MRGWCTRPVWTGRAMRLHMTMCSLMEAQTNLVRSMLVTRRHLLLRLGEGVRMLGIAWRPDNVFGSNLVGAWGARAAAAMCQIICKSQPHFWGGDMATTCLPIGAIIPRLLRST